MQIRSCVFLFAALCVWTATLDAGEDHVVRNRHSPVARQRRSLYLQEDFNHLEEQEAYQVYCHRFRSRRHLYLMRLACQAADVATPASTKVTGMHHLLHLIYGPAPLKACR